MMMPDEAGSRECSSRGNGRAGFPVRRTAAASRLTGLLLLCLLAVAMPGRAQVMQFQGGSSSLYDAHGGSVLVYGENYTGRVSLGYADGLRTGFSLLLPFRGYTLNFGDQTVPFNMPTDQLNRSFYFLGRGASAGRKTGKSHLFVYAGMTSKALFVPYLSVAQAQNPVGLVFYDRELARGLRFYSYNILSKRQTSIQSLEWQPRKHLTLAVAGGVGSNQRYGSASINFDRQWIKLLASYVAAGPAFQRIRVDNPVQSETDRENVRLELVPRSWLRLSYDRQNYVSPATPGVFPRASVNGYSGLVTAGGFLLHGSLYDSTTAGGHSRAISGGVRRNFHNWLDVSEDYYRSKQAAHSTQHSLVTTLREKLSRRITLAEYITTGNGQTTATFGGTFFSNRFSFDAEYQTVYFPLAQGGNSQFKQIFLVNLRLLLPHSIELNGLSEVLPTGRVRYTGYFSAYSYRGLGGIGAGGPAQGPGMHTNLVRGRVLDDHGQPVRGAAVRVENEIAFTNTEGEFQVRRKHAGDIAFEVVLDQFMVPGRFEVVNAPKTVHAAREEVAPLAEVVIRRLPSLPETPVQAGGEKRTTMTPAPGKAQFDLYTFHKNYNLVYSFILAPMAPSVPYTPPGAGSGRSQKKNVGPGGRSATACGDSSGRATQLPPGKGAAGCPGSGKRAGHLESPGHGGSAQRKHGTGSTRSCRGAGQHVPPCAGPGSKLRVPARGKRAWSGRDTRAAAGERKPAAPIVQLPPDRDANPPVAAQKTGATKSSTATN